MGGEKLVGGTKVMGRSAPESDQADAWVHASRAIDTPLHQPDLMAELARRLATSGNTGIPLMLAAIELRQFGAIRELYGRETANRFRMAVQGRLSRVFGAGDYLAYLGKGWFAAITQASRVDPDASGEVLWSRLLTTLTGRFGLGGPVIDYAGPAVSIVIVPSSEAAPEAVLAHAYGTMRESVPLH